MIKTLKKAKHRTSPRANGKYDPRNKLNDLTGREWIYFTNSVWITGYSPTAIDNVGLEYRRIHPSPKPPGLIKDIILFFTKTKGQILDPFVGVGGTLLGAALAGGCRSAIGIDLEKKYKEAYLKVCKKENLESMEFIVGNSKKVLDDGKRMGKKQFDLIIADPPYSNMMQRKRTGKSSKKSQCRNGTPYSNNDNDLGNMPEDKFLESLKEIIKLASNFLKKEKYIVLFCKDFQPKSNNTNLLHCKVVNKINEIESLEYKGMRIWHDQAMSLYPFGYPFAFVMNQIHQYILIFRKVL